MLAAVSDQVFFTQDRILVRHDESLGDFALLFVSGAGNGDHCDRRVHGNDLLKLSRIDVVASGNDHVFLAVDDEDETVLVSTCNIAGRKPALRIDGFFCGSFVAPVALGD